MHTYIQIHQPSRYRYMAYRYIRLQGTDTLDCKVQTHYTQIHCMRIHQRQIHCMRIYQRQIHQPTRYRHITYRYIACRYMRNRHIRLQGTDTLETDTLHADILETDTLDYKVQTHQRHLASRASRSMGGCSVQFSQLTTLTKLCRQTCKKLGFESVEVYDRSEAVRKRKVLSKET